MVLCSELVGCPPGMRTASLPEIPQCHGLCFDMVTFFRIKKESPWEKTGLIYGFHSCLPEERKTD